MRVVIVTSSVHGTAPVHLDKLVSSGVCEVAGVILCRHSVSNRKKYFLKKARKVFRIGVGGALTGVMMRNWFGRDTYAHLPHIEMRQFCRQHQISLFETSGVNSAETRSHLGNLDADLGISLGNGYIGRGVFSIPRLGMINIHHEILPDYQNAQSVIWQLYNGSASTGYTIHRIDSGIDTGEILMQEHVPIIFRPTLRETVAATYADLITKSADGLVNLIAAFEMYSKDVRPQSGGAKYTTPSFRQFLRILRNHNKLKLSIRNV